MLTFRDFIQINETIWFSAVETNGLFQMNLMTGATVWKGCFPGEEILRRNLYGTSLLYKNKIVFVPLTAKEIAVYDLGSDSFEKYSLPYEIEQMEWKFASAALYENKVYCFPGNSPQIISFSMETRELKCTSVERLREKNNKLFSTRIIGIENEKVYIQILNKKQICIFNMKKDYFMDEAISTEKMYTGVLCNEYNLYLIPDIDSMFEKVDLLTGEIKKIKVPRGFESGNNIKPFSITVKDKTNIYAFPNGSNMTVKIDCDTNLAEALYFPEKKKKGEIIHCNCIKKIDSDRWLMVLTGEKYRKIYIVNLEKWKFNELVSFFEVDFLELYFKKNRHKINEIQEKWVEESFSINILEHLDWILGEVKETILTDNCGMIIHEKIKGEL